MSAIGSSKMQRRGVCQCANKHRCVSIPLIVVIIYLLMSNFTTGFMLLAVIKACSSLWLVIKGTLQIGTTSDPLKIIFDFGTGEILIKSHLHS